MSQIQLPQFALSIRQPWAWAILHAGKNIENRDWPTSVRGPVAIHAAKGMTLSEYRQAMFAILDTNLSLDRSTVPLESQLTRGAIIGRVEIVNCVQMHQSRWFMGQYGFVLRNPVILAKPIPCKGRLGFWPVPTEIHQQTWEAK